MLGCGRRGVADVTWTRAWAGFRARCRSWFPLETRAKLDVEYADPSTGRREHEEFQLVTTAPHLGGRRWWVACACGRRCRVLYLAPDREGFRCRRCHGLAYRSQRMTRKERLHRRAWALGERLGAVRGYGPVPAEKPKWMRWRTYDRGRDRVLALSLAALCESIDPAEFAALGLGPPPINT